MEESTCQYLKEGRTMTVGCNLSEQSVEVICRVLGGVKVSDQYT